MRSCFVVMERNQGSEREHRYEKSLAAMIFFPSFPSNMHFPLISNMRLPFCCPFRAFQCFLITSAAQCNKQTKASELRGARGEIDCFRGGGGR